MAAKKRASRVHRPLRKSDFEIVLASSSAEKGWRDLLATTRNPMVTTWEFLTATPLSTTEANYRLKDKLATVSVGGVQHHRWQHKPTTKGDARIWFYVVDRTVYIEQVFTAHPNATK